MDTSTTWQKSEGVATFLVDAKTVCNRCSMVKSGRPFSVMLLALLFLVSAGCVKNEDVLRDAMGNSEWEKAKQLIKDHPALALSRDSSGDTPLFQAARDNEEIVKLLLANKADVNATNETGQTPLFFAATSGHVEIVDLLLQRGADPNIKGFCGPPLCGAMMFRRSDTLAMAKTLVAHGARVDLADGEGRTPLHEAVRSGLTDTAAFLIEQGADVNAKSAAGETPLHAAVYYSDLAELLLAKKADPNVRNKDGQTPLYAAIHAHRGWGVGLLVNTYKADVNLGDNRGTTPLGEAASRGLPEVVEILLNNGAEMDAKGYLGKTPLSWAALAGSTNVVNILLARHADANSRDDEGKTPLHSSAIWGHVDVAELLITNGADINAKDIQGQTPLVTARGYGNLQFANWLQQRGGHE